MTHAHTQEPPMTLADSIRALARALAADPRRVSPADIAAIAADVERLERFADEVVANARIDAQPALGIAA